jgi:hypothetical protein
LFHELALRNDPTGLQRIGLVGFAMGKVRKIPLEVVPMIFPELLEDSFELLARRRQVHTGYLIRVSLFSLCV